MGAALSAPMPELTRHCKNRMHHHRPRPHVNRRKVMEERGFSPMDWVRLTKKDPDLAGRNGAPLRRDITLEEVARHSTAADAWTVLRGKVYNMTPYLRFHPGGVALLLKIAGKDGTELFDQYHAWVSPDALLEKCLVGWLAKEAPPTKAGGEAPAGRQQCGEEERPEEQQQGQQQQQQEQGQPPLDPPRQAAVGRQEQQPPVPAKAAPGASIGLSAHASLL